MSTPTDILARDFTFQLNTGTVSVPVWVSIGGINTWSDKPSSKDADTTKFSDAGAATHLKASRNREWTLKGLLQEDSADGVRDAGQDACDTWANSVGAASRKQFKITSPGGRARTALATAELVVGGGSNDDPAAWELTVKTSGAITRT